MGLNYSIPVGSYRIPFDFHRIPSGFHLDSMWNAIPFWNGIPGSRVVSKTSRYTFLFWAEAEGRRKKKTERRRRRQKEEEGNRDPLTKIGVKTCVPELLRQQLNYSIPIHSPNPIQHNPIPIQFIGIELLGGTNWR